MVALAQQWPSMRVPSGRAGHGFVAIDLVRAVRHGELAGLGRRERRGRERRDERGPGHETDETSGVGCRGDAVIHAPPLRVVPSERRGFERAARGRVPRAPRPR